MRTGLTKKQKTTAIYFDEHSRMIEVQTHNTDLKKRLTAFAGQSTRNAAARPTQTRTRAAWNLESARGGSPFG